jgi:uncharacterized membrane protein YfcA
MLLAGGFAVGGLLGGWLVSRHVISDRGLRVMFSFFLLYVAGNMLFRSENRVQAALKTAVILAGFGVMYVGARVLGRRLERRLDLPEVYRRRLSAPLPPDYEI